MILKLNNKAFSLIEVMVGVAILSVMALMMYATTGRALKGSQKVEKKDELLHSVRLGVGKMGEDLSQAFLASDSFKGKEKKYQTGLKGDTEKIDFSTLSHSHYQWDAKDTEQATVGYFLKTNEKGLNDLIRRESPRLGEEIDQGGDEYVLIENIKELRLEYFDSKKEEWVSEWDSESISTLNRLPLAVRISLKVVEVREDDFHEVIREYPFSTVALVDMYKNAIDF